MTKKNYLSVGVIVIVLISVGVVIFTRQNKNTPVQCPNISINTQTPSNTSKTDIGSIKPDSSVNKQLAGLAVDLGEVKSDLQITPIQADQIKKQNPTVIKIEDAVRSQILCQPKNFDPNITKYSKISDPNSIPSEFYEIDDLEAAKFTISNSKDLILPEPLKITQYIFGCGSTQDSTIDIQFNGKRIYLIQFVSNFITQKQISKNGKYIFLNYYKLEEGQYINRSVIVDLVAQKMIDLSSFNCSARGFWGLKDLITFSNTPSNNPRPATNSFPQDINVCVFDSSGSLKDSFSYKSISQSNSGNTYTDIWIDSMDKYISLYNGSYQNTQSQNCYLSVYNMENKSLKEATIATADQTGSCPFIDVQKLEENRAVINITN